jgi:hypothetical protein
MQISVIETTYKKGAVITNIIVSEVQIDLAFTYNERGLKSSFRQEKNQKCSRTSVDDKNIHILHGMWFTA